MGAGMTWKTNKGRRKVQQRDEYLWSLYYDQQMENLRTGDSDFHQIAHPVTGKIETFWNQGPGSTPQPPIAPPPRNPGWDKNPFDSEEWYERQREHDQDLFPGGGNPLPSTWNPNTQAGGSGTQRRSNQKPRKRGY